MTWPIKYQDSQASGQSGPTRDRPGNISSENNCCIYTNFRPV